VLHHNPGVPPDFVGLVRRLMAKNPEARPASAAAIREELLTWVGDGPVLPMDRPEDGSFQQEVLRLEAAEPSPEPLEEVSSVAEALPAVDEPVMDLGLTPPPGSLMRVVPRAPRKDTEPETDNDRQRLILGAIAGGLTFTIGAAILTALVLFLRH
jgi:hypothetical protein